MAKIRLIALYFLCFLQPLLGAETGHYIKFVHPKNVSVISKDYIRIDIQTDYTDIGYINIYARFDDELTISRTGRPYKIFLGADSTPPYEWIWHCDSISDRIVEIIAIPYNKHSKPIQNGSISTVFIVDRRTDTPSCILKSYYFNKPIQIDGRIKEWTSLDSGVFENDDNRIVVKTVWNINNLYFMIQVQDQFIFADTMENNGKILPYYDLKKEVLTNESEVMLRLFDYDEIELCFDLNSNRGTYKKEDDLDIIVSPLGKLQGNFSFWDSTGKPFQRLWKNRAQIKSRIMGAINDNAQRDTGYVIELAIPWQDLNVKPGKNMTFSFDMVNVDRDGPGKRKFFISWCRTNWLTNDNPSEFGTLMLVKPRSLGKLYFTFIIIAVIAFLGAVFLIKIRTQKNKNDNSKPNRQYDPRIQKAIDLVRAQYKDDITADEVTKHVGLSPAHFSKLFTKETGLPFSQYVIKFRIEKAKKLLSETTMNVSEIAYSVGFNSSQHFSTTFGKVAGMSPGEWKRK